MKQRIPSIDEFINESAADVRSVYLSLRNVKSVNDPHFLYYLTKEYMEVGYYDKTDDKKFKRAFNDVIEWFNSNPNMQRIAKEKDYVISYNEILAYKNENED